MVGLAVGVDLQHGAIVERSSDLEDALIPGDVEAVLLRNDPVLAATFEPETLDVGSLGIVSDDFDAAHGRRFVVVKQWLADLRVLRHGLGPRVTGGRKCGSYRRYDAHDDRGEVS